MQFSHVFHFGPLSPSSPHPLALLSPPVPFLRRLPPHPLLFRLSGLFLAFWPFSVYSPLQTHSSQRLRSTGEREHTLFAFLSLDRSPDTLYKHHLYCSAVLCRTCGNCWLASRRTWKTEKYFRKPGFSYVTRKQTLGTRKRSLKSGLSIFHPSIN